MNSEKYELRWRDYDAKPNLNDAIRRLNRARREHSALQRADNLTFHTSENDAVLFFRKAGGLGRGAGATPATSATRHEDLLVAVNVDPFHTRESIVHVPVSAMGIGPDEPYEVEDLLTGDRFVWRGVRNYVKLDPWRDQPGHLLRVNRRGSGRT